MGEEWNNPGTFNGARAGTVASTIDTANEVNSQSRSSGVLADRLRVAAAQTYRYVEYVYLAVAIA